MQITEGLEWLHIYWVRGKTPKGSRYLNEVTDPPCSGWQHALVMRRDKRATIFCPYSFTSYSVRAVADEIEKSEEPRDQRDAEWVADLMTRKWKELQSQGAQRDYQAAAAVFRKLGVPVPEQIMKGGEEDTRKKGGKEVGSSLLKPVKLKGKRGQFLKWFMDGENSRSVREAMLEFDMTRSNALSYLYMLQKDHGIGYELIGDIATIVMPDGCSNPFDVPMEDEEPDAEPEEDLSWLDDPEDEEEDDDDWLS